MQGSSLPLHPGACTIKKAIETASHRGDCEADKGGQKTLKVPEKCIPAKIAEYRQVLRINPTPAEKRFRKALQLVANMARFDFDFQAVYHNPDAGKYYIVDFAVPFHKLIIEIDGPTHETDGQKSNDAERDSAFVNHGFKVLRIKNNDTKNHVATIKRICESLLKTTHSLKAYSVLKKIKEIERQRHDIESKFKNDLGGAFDSAIQRIFEEKKDKTKLDVKAKPKPKGKPKRVKCSGCGFLLYPNERQCPMCQTIRQVSRKYINKATPIKSAINFDETSPKSRLRKAIHQEDQKAFS